MNTEDDRSSQENSDVAEKELSSKQSREADAPMPTLEDRPAEPQPAIPETTPAAAVAKKEPWITRAARWVFVSLLFLVLGAAGVYFTLTLPANQQVEALNQAAATAANQIGTLQSGLQTAQSGLAAATATVEAQNAQFVALNTKNTVYKMISDVDTIRVSLLRFDTITANQALTNARSDITALSALGVDQSTLDGFTVRLNNASTTLSTNSQQSMIELDNLIDNLYLLATNLK